MDGGGPPTRLSYSYAPVVAEGVTKKSVTDGLLRARPKEGPTRSATHSDHPSSPSIHHLHPHIDHTSPTMAANGNGHCAGAALSHVFPEALSSLKLADPEIYSIIQDEKARQWCVVSA